jgi:ATP-dependent RNA helicase MRH4
MDKSKILIFTNRSSRALSLGYELTAQGIPNVTLTSTSSTRKNAYGSNRHIDTFLRHPEKRDKVEDLQSAAIRDKDQIHVLITTSLLSRGIDFHPSVRHVFIVDPPRNMVDFIHRAGRTARAGMEGKIVIFGKKKGRGSAEGDRVKQRLKALTMK